MDHYLKKGIGKERDIGYAVAKKKNIQNMIQSDNIE